MPISLLLGVVGAGAYYMHCMSSKHAI